MQDGFIPDVVISSKLDKYKAELFDYISNNTEYIDENFPVFFGKIASILERANVSIPDSVHDEFVDAITYRMMDASSRASDPKFISRLCEIACGIKRRKEKKAGIHLAVAVKLMKISRYLDAMAYLKPYWKHDAVVGCWYAYCYYALFKEGSTEPGYNSGERWNYLKASRQHLEELSQWKPGINRLVVGELRTDPWLEQPFWLMIFSATEWLPETRWFLEVGFNKAKKDRNDAVLVKMLQVALVRFPDDLFFLREAYRLKFEQAELGEALSLIRDMIAKYPDELEPIYLGIRTSFYISGDAEYNEFRRLAEQKGMAGHILLVIDFAYAYIRGRQSQATLFLDEFKRTYPALSYYSSLLEFVTTECSDKVDGIRRTVFLSVDSFCMRMLNLKEL
jgi:hypothetical protein